MVIPISVPDRFKGKTFESYEIKNNSQKIVVEKAKEFLKSPENTGLIFIGKCGTGKTHLAMAIRNEFHKEHYESVYYDRPIPTVIFKSMFHIMQSIKETWNNKRIEEKTVLRDYYTTKLLIIEEVGVQFNTDTEKVYLDDIINVRYENIKPTIMISNLNLENLTAYVGDRIIDRFREGGDLLVFDWDSYRKENRGKSDEMSL